MDVVTAVAARHAEPVIDRSEDQARLDLRRRSRTSLFPWRGQFSPELVELLLEDVGSDAPLVDPFVGSGTTLFESARLGRPAFGADINPAALAFAALSELLSEPRGVRSAAVKVVLRSLGRCTSHGHDGMFATHEGPDAATAVKEVLSELGGHIAAADVMRAAVLLAMGNGTDLGFGRLHAALRRLERLLATLPESRAGCRAVAADARKLPLPDGAAGGVLMSPPYINVFNYHQQYRPAVEFLGAMPLTVARAEMGANRKHRQNRFLTVVQYSIDLADALAELHRVLVPNARAKVVIGRESNVRGVPFRNGQLIATLAEGCGAFAVERWQERRFTTRFGDDIFEDVITLRRTPTLDPIHGFAPRDVGCWALRNGLVSVKADDVRADIEAAIAAADDVSPSPLFDVDAIPWMRDRPPAAPSSSPQAGGVSTGSQPSRWRSSLPS